MRDLNVNDVIAQIEHEVTVLKAERAGQAPTDNLIWDGLYTASSQGQELALRKLQLWIAEHMTARARA
jgi:hypothetical protein